MMSDLFIFLIKQYQKILSPILTKFGVKCRFHPTCSQYAILAFKKYGIYKGSIKSFQRLKRCNPNNLDTCIDFP